MRILLAVALVLAASHGARADGGGGGEPDPPREPYRNMMIMLDAESSLFWIGGGALAYRARNCQCEDFSAELVVFGVLPYLTWGALGHHEAGRDDRAVASVAIRVGLPIAAAVLAHDAGGSPWEASLAAGGAMVGAMVIDWFLLADRTAPGKPKASNVSLVVQPIDRGMTVGFAGRLPR